VLAAVPSVYIAWQCMVVIPLLDLENFEASTLLGSTTTTVVKRELLAPHTILYHHQQQQYTHTQSAQSIVR
jgi:hypothetical protein